ncbi:MAG: hypothetical protein ISP90_08070 [Nevskia sp.]|nr:hypothetical protein [Nevskia sp.]
MVRKPPKFPPAEDLQKIVASAIQNFRGQSGELESAIGMLYMGYAFGWKVIYITHTIATVRKYEKILGIVAKDVFPEDTHLSDRNLGYRIARTVSNFWKVVKGEKNVEGFRNREIVLD